MVPEGWTATEPGYFGTLEDGRDTLAALQTYRETSERWKAAYSDLRTEFLTSNEDVQKRFDALAGQLNNERKAWKEAWKAESVRWRVKNWVWLIVGGGIGFAAGR